MATNRRRLALALAAALLACSPAAAELPPPGAITWEQALAVIRSGEVRSVMQSHDLAVAITTKSGARYTTKEPRIDDVIRAAREEAPNAGEIAIMTE